MKRVLFLLISIVLLSSCEKEIEFTGEMTDSKLVINSVVRSGHRAEAFVSKSYFFLDNQANTTAPDDLVASLYVNGNLLGEMTPHYDTVVSYDIWDPNNPNLGRVQKVYTYDYCPAVGDIIKITASAKACQSLFVGIIRARRNAAARGPRTSCRGDPSWRRDRWRCRHAG